tara:strand:- start:12342 stop:13283 length:942 start_codon:yes stop_codon:yes gene_type:complete
LKEIAIVTGGAGFIGANIVRTLLEKDYEVHVFDNLSSGNIDNLNLKRIKFYNIDLKKELKYWPNIFAKKIFHFAANADVRGGMNNHEIDFKENLLVTKNVCDYAVKNNIKNLIFSSSATVYGEPDVFPTPETYISNQTSLYGASKISCESFIQAYSHYGYFKSTIFRFVSWIGQGYSHGVIYDFVNKLLSDSSKLVILGDGTQEKSYLDVEDGIDAVLNISDLQTEESSIFNLGHDQKMSVKRLADIVCNEMNLTNVRYEYTGGKRGWLGDSPLVLLETKKAKLLGFKSKIDIEESIRKTVRYLITNKSRRFR